MSGWPRQRLGPFDLITPVGRGGTGIVWKGLHRDSGVPIAVKILHSEAWREAGAAQSLRNEVRSIASLDHPGIIWIHDAGKIDAETARGSGGEFEEGSPYFVMEYASGGSLADGVPTTWEEIRSLILGLLRALAHAHARGIVHRDLKPGNVLRAMPSDLRPGWKLTDFGIATVLEQTVTRSIAGELVGTLAYMSPEQIRGDWRDYGPWTDLYALGCLIYRVVGNQRPFGAVKGPALIAAHLSQPPQPLGPLVPVPHGFGAWVSKLLEKEPQDRFQSAAEAEWLLLQLGTPAPRAPVPPSPDDDLVLPEEIPGDGEGPTELVRGGSTHGMGPLPEDWREGFSPDPIARELGAGLSLFGLRSIPMVGRLAERDLLWEKLRTAIVRGKAEVVVIRGPTGVGKTRLARWFGETAHARAGLPFLSGEARAEESAYEALARPFRRWFRTVRLDEKARRKRLERVLGGRHDLANVASSLLATSAPANAATEIGPEGRYAVARQLLEVIAGQGAVLVLDDIHLAPEILRFATQLIRSQSVRPLPAVLVLVASTPSPEISGELSDLLSRPGATLIDLGPLPRDDHERLVEGMLPLEGTLSAKLVERTSGNPMHAVEIVRGWVAAQRLIEQEGHLVLDGPEPAVAPLPEVWRDRLKRLFDGLPTAARSMLERAAALGTNVDEDEWQRVCDDPKGQFAAAGQIRFLPESAALREELRTRLISQGLAVDTDFGFFFVHELFRETLLTLAGAAGRLGSHHRSCARMLLHRSDSRRYAERIGRHLLKGSRPEEAIPQLVEAFRQRLDSQGDRAALPMLGEIEDALSMASIPQTDLRWIELFVWRAELFHRLQRYSDARRVAADAERRAREGGHRLLYARAAHVIGEGLLQEGDLGAADVALARAEGLVREGEDPRLLGAVHAARSLCADGLGDAPRARAHAVLAARYLTEISHGRGLAEAWAVLGDRSLRHEAYADAERAFERVRALHASAGNLVGVASAHAQLAEVSAARGDLDLARSHWNKAIHLFRDGGSPGVQHAIVGLACTELSRRDWAEAYRLASLVLGELEPSALGLLAACYAVLSAATAAMRDWAAFDVHLERLASAIERLSPQLGTRERFGVREVDIGRCLELAVARADAADELKRSRQARLVAGRIGAGR